MRLSLMLLITHGKRQRKLGGGKPQRLNILRRVVTGLVRHERIESTYAQCDEAKFYAERLIDYAKLGNTNAGAMRIADYWITEKDLIPKLFETLAPRFADHDGRYCRLYRLPVTTQNTRDMAVLEYKGNPYPSLRPIPKNHPNSIANILVEGLRQDYEKKMEIDMKDQPAA
uniref:Large ribosomal subunit protein bL17m n=1 Tax=Branchiostoma floridae TaxID=7739 RepID=C3YC16_BRAFL|eukprot:XP_002606181.1 hypothetical protein BRAFLDRAFT_115378 [Branchiostoma floridae]